MKNKLKLIASDVDKTLVYRNDKIPKELKESVLIFQKKSNSKLTLVTGRNFFLAKQISKELKIKLPIITSNGAVVIDPISEKFLYLNSIEENKIIKIIDLFKNFEVDITLYTEFEMLCLKSSKWFSIFGKNSKFYSKKYRPKIKSFLNYNNLMQYLVQNKLQITRILLDFTKENLAIEGFEILDKTDLYPLLYINSEETVIEIFNFNTNKAIGLIKLINFLEIEKNEVGVFGDQINDIEMFEQFGYSFVVENGINELKKIAFKEIGSVYKNGVGKELIELLKFIA